MNQILGLTQYFQSEKNQILSETSTIININSSDKSKELLIRNGK